MQKIAKTKLSELNMDWKEAYTEKTEFLKKQFEDVIGEGSYFRFEGKNLDTGDEYYCIIGPAKIKDPMAKFFAGTRKLPATYSAGGKYFDSLDAAAQYAHETWGVKIPSDLKPYTSGQLHGIAEKVKKWKKRHEEEEKEIAKEEREENKEKEEKKGGLETLSMKSFNLLMYKEAMGYTWHATRQPLKWWSLEDITGGNSEWSDVLASEPSLSDVVKEAQALRAKKFNVFKDRYGGSEILFNQVDKFFIGYHPAYGSYICSVGLYLPEWQPEPNKVDSFGYYTLRKRKVSSEELFKSLKKNIEEYSDKFGVKLEPSDFNFVRKTMEEGVSTERKHQKYNPPEIFPLSLEHPENVNLRDPEVISILTRHKPEIADITNPVDRAKALMEAAQEILIPEDPKTKSFFASAPISTKSSEIVPNAEGMQKIISGVFQHHYGKLFTEAMHEFLEAQEQASKREGRGRRAETMTEEELWSKIYSGDSAALSMLQKIYKIMKRKYDEAVKSGDASVIGMIPPPAFKDMTLSHISGAVIPTELPTNIFHTGMLKLKREIIQIMKSGKTDVKEITDILNTMSPTRKKQEQRRITEEEVSKYVEDIKKEMSTEEKEKTVEQLESETTQTITQLEEKSGFDDLKTAFNIAKYWLAGDAITTDPKTRAKLSTEGYETPVFCAMPENFQNITKTQIKELRENFEKQKRGLAPRQEPETAPEKETIGEGELALDIGAAPTSPIKREKPIIPEKAEPVEEVAGVVETPAVLEKEEDKIASTNIKTIFKTAILQLIKIAEKLDNDGKYEDAEKIHNLIRKHTERAR